MTITGLLNTQTEASTTGLVLSYVDETFNTNYVGPADFFNPSDFSRTEGTMVLTLLKDLEKDTQVSQM